jgi:hypothetical protein
MLEKITLDNSVIETLLASRVPAVYFSESLLMNLCTGLISHRELVSINRSLRISPDILRGPTHSRIEVNPCCVHGWVLGRGCHLSVKEIATL